MKRLAILSMFLFAPAVHADGWRVDSGPARAVLIELFTSEGCSSCPPAEAWLNRLAGSDQLWRSYVPVARHVGYWDYLGWPDRFADPAHADSQRRYASSGALSAVYTPAFVVNGRGWRPGFTGSLPPAAGEQAGHLRLELDGHELRARYEPPAGAPRAERLHVAVLGMGLVSEIRAGENGGRQLHHDFVTLALRSFESTDDSWSGRLPDPRPGLQPARFALAAWVTGPGNLTPLQAAGGYLPDSLFVSR